MVFFGSLGGAGRGLPGGSVGGFGWCFGPGGIDLCGTVLLLEVLAYEHGFMVARFDE